MRTNLRTFAIVALAALAFLVAAPAAVAQRGMRGMAMGGLQYLGRKDVQKDLKLSDKQLADLDEARQKMMSDMRDIFQNSGGDRDAAMKAMQAKMPEMQKTILAILTPEQQARLKEITIQMDGNTAVANDPELQTKLKITEDQKAKISALQAKQQEANQGLFAKMRNGEMDQDAMRAALTKNGEALSTEIGKILTDDQKKQLASMEGKKFDKDPNETGFGGGGGGGH